MTDRAALLFVPGSRWDDVPGTDRQLATALAERVPVLWVDPGFTRRLPPDGVRSRWRDREDVVAPGLVRLQFVVPPAASRAGVRGLAGGCRLRAVRRAVRRGGRRVRGTVLSSPQARFPTRVGGRRLLFVTDDWLAGAGMMGLSRRRVAHVLTQNLHDADTVAAVTPDLLERLATPSGSRTVVLPNGCPAPRDRPVGGLRDGAVLLGQLNERLDLDAVEAVVRAGVPVTVLGPRTERDPATGARLDALLGRAGVRWLGQVPHEQVAGHLGAVKLGLTPYIDDDFNRASFPLKTLEYLGAGLPVVSTDLPAARRLGDGVLGLAGSAQAFADHAVRLVGQPWDDVAAGRRAAVAAQHTWSARAGQVLELLR